MELVDTHDSKSCAERHVGSIPTSGTTKRLGNVLVARPQNMQLFFDILIAILFSITVLPAVILLSARNRKFNSWEYKHKNLSLLMVVILLIGSTILLYGSFIEPRILVTNYYEVDLPNLEKPIRIAFLSDFQVGKYKQTDWTTKLVNRILILKPDLVFIGGDQVDNESYEPEEFDYLLPLKDLAKKIPTYAVLGNHEYGIGSGLSVNNSSFRVADVSEEAIKNLNELGINIMRNNLEIITINSSSFYLFGGDEYWGQHLKFDNLANRKDNIPTLALIHNPAFILESHPTMNLILSGHTHGGQIRLPFLGPIGIVDQFLPKMYYQGLHNFDNQDQILITSGAGESGARARLFNPPEIILLTIK